MNTLKSAAVAAAALVTLVACQPAPPDTAAEKSEIQKVNVAWGEGFNAGDADAVANLYWEDAVVLAPGVPAAQGRAAIRELMANDIASAKAAGLTNNIAQASEIGVSGDLAWQNGTFTVTDASGTTIDVGKYVSVFQKRDGKWLMIATPGTRTGRPLRPPRQQSRLQSPPQNLRPSDSRPAGRVPGTNPIAHWSRIRPPGR